MPRMTPRTRIAHRAPSPTLHPVLSSIIECSIFGTHDYETIQRRRAVVRRLTVALYVVLAAAAFRVGMWLGAA